MNEEMKVLLGIIDTFHDFYDLDIKKTNNNVVFFNLLNYYRIFYLDRLKENPLRQIDIKNENFSNLFNNECCFPNVNTKTFRVFFEEYFKGKLNLQNEGISFEVMNNTIIGNFDKIFDVDLRRFSADYNNNLKNFLSNLEKLKLRHQIYFLINNKDNFDACTRIIEFILEYMNLLIITEKLLLKIKESIFDNLKKYKFTNLTYPLTFFDDMSSGLNKFGLFRFKILNLDKRYIDEARVESVDNYLMDEYGRKNDKQLLLNDARHALAFTVEEKIDKISFLGSRTFLEKPFLVSSFNGIKFKLKQNKVGRGYSKKKDTESNNEQKDDEKKDSNIGLYQIALALVQAFNNAHNYIKKEHEVHPLLIHELDKIHGFFDIISNKIQYIKELINPDYIIYSRSFLKNKDFIPDDIKEKLDWNNNTTPRLNRFDDCYIDLKVRIDELLQHYQSYNNDIHNTTIDMYDKYKVYKRMIDYINVFLLKLFECRDISEKVLIPPENHHIFFQMVETNKNKIKRQLVLKPCSRDDFELALKFPRNFDTNYVKNGSLTEAGKYLVFLTCIRRLEDRKELYKSMDTSDLYIQLYNIYIKYKNISLALGCIVFLIFNAKRYGDWIQAELAKKFYFLLQTKDFYCQMYSLLIGAPILRKKTLSDDPTIDENDENQEIPDVNDSSYVFYFNELPNNIFSEDYNKQFRMVDKDGVSNDLSSAKIQYNGLRNVSAPNATREYFDKYFFSNS